VTQSVKHPTLLGFGSGHDLMGPEIKPREGLLTQWGVLEKSLSLCPAPHSLACSLPLSKINL